MSLPVILRPEAQADIRESYAYLEQIRTGLGDEFASRLSDVFQRIESMPELHGMVWNDVRAVRVRKFQYVVYYVAFSDRIEVLGVLHGARQEPTWQARA